MGFSSFLIKQEVLVASMTHWQVAVVDGNVDYLKIAGPNFVS